MLSIILTTWFMVPYLAKSALETLECIAPDYDLLCNNNNSMHNITCWVVFLKMEWNWMQYHYLPDKYIFLQFVWYIRFHIQCFVLKYYNVIVTIINLIGYLKQLNNYQKLKYKIKKIQKHKNNYQYNSRKVSNKIDYY